MPDEWDLIAEAVKQRRMDLRLSQREAAQLAGVSPTTWQSLEKHKQPVADITAAGMARALGWGANAFALIAEGKEPTMNGHTETQVVAAIRADKGLSSAQRQALIAAYEAYQGSRR